MPSLAPETALSRRLSCPIVGIDEAGRGPWAGPVVAACVYLEPEKLSKRLLFALDDSKKLSEVKREAIFAELALATRHGIGLASAQEIDRLNVLQATFLAMRRAFDALGLPGAAALVDGNQAPPLPTTVETLVEGDGLSSSIAAASILAKVTRDRLMSELDRQHPGYGWARNKGYGTAQHRAALLDLGVSAEHRRSFAPIRAILEVNI